MAAARQTRARRGTASLWSPWRTSTPTTAWASPHQKRFPFSALLFSWGSFLWLYKSNPWGISLLFYSFRNIQKPAATKLLEVQTVSSEPRENLSAISGLRGLAELEVPGLLHVYRWHHLWPAAKLEGFTIKWRGLWEIEVSPSSPAYPLLPHKWLKHISISALRSIPHEELI